VKPLGSFPAFYGTRKFITVFTRALHLYLSWTRPVQSTTLYPISKRSILMLCIHLRLGLPSGLFPPGFSTNNKYAFLFSPIRATCTAHLILLEFIILIIQKLYKYKKCPYQHHHGPSTPRIRRPVSCIVIPPGDVCPPVTGRLEGNSRTPLTNSLAFSQQADYIDWATATGLNILNLTFADRGVSCGRCGRTPTPVNLSFLDRSRYFSFK
jgi:hypothetical protein